MVSGILVTRTLGPENRGYHALLVLVPYVLCYLGNLGLPTAATYFIAREPVAVGAIVRSLVRVAVVQTLLLVVLHAVILFVLTANAPPTVWTAAMTTVALVPVTLAQQYGLAIIQGQQRFTALNILRPVTATAYTIAVVLAVVIGRADDLMFVALAWVVANTVAGCLILAVAWRRLPSPVPGALLPSVRPMLRFGLKGILGTASPVDTFRLDQAVIGLLLLPVDLGLYVAGLAFTNPPRILAGSIGYIAYPYIAAQTNRVTAQAMVWRFVAITTVVTGAVVVGLAAIAGIAVPFFFGDDFNDSVPVARLLLLGGLFYSVRRVLGDGMRGLGQPGLNTLAEVTSWLWLVPALIILTPRLGIEGVAVALASASGVGLAVLVTAATIRRNGPRAAPPVATVPEASLAPE